MGTLPPSVKLTFLLCSFMLICRVRSLCKSQTSFLSCNSFFLASCHMWLLKCLHKRKIFKYANKETVLFSTNYLATSLWHPIRAQSRGVFPMSSWANMSAPAWMRISTQSSRPSEAAKCSGVFPEFVLLSKKISF